jgi:hypothetical protein
LSAAARQNVNNNANFVKYCQILPIGAGHREDFPKTAVNDMNRESAPPTAVYIKERLAAHDTHHR